MTSTKALMMVPRYWPQTGGAELHSRRLAQELSQDIDIDILRFNAETDTVTDFAYARAQSGIVNDGGMSVHTLSSSGPNAALLRGLSRTADRLRPARRAFNMLARRDLAPRLRQLTREHDVVHGVYNGFTAGFEALADTGKPFVFTPLTHTTKPEGTAWSSPQFKRLYQRADALIAMTEYEREWLTAQGADADKVHVCPMAPLFDLSKPDPDGFRARWDLGDAPVILFLGRLTGYKGYRQLIAAADRVWQEHPATRFVIAGPGERPAGLSDDRLVFTGSISDPEKKSAIAACDLLCVPSTEESLGVVYLEAWSFGKPVIAADIPAMRSVIRHGHDGWLVDQDAGAIADRILILLDDPDRMLAAGRAGALKVERIYNWAQSARQLRSIYADIA